MKCETTPEKTNPGHVRFVFFRSIGNVRGTYDKSLKTAVFHDLAAVVFLVTQSVSFPWIPYNEKNTIYTPWSYNPLKTYII